MISKVILTKLLYLASVLDLTSKGCFLDHDDIRFCARNTHALDADLLTSMIDA